MSGKAGPDLSTAAERHAPAWLEGPATIVSWLTVIPCQGARVFDRVTGARAMASLPVAGLVLGVAVGIVAGLLDMRFFPVFVAASAVTAFALLTRMMHIDGLADVCDALGSYAPPERAREILADSSTGALGMGAVLFTVLMQVAAVAEVVRHTGPIETALAVCIIPVLARLGGMVGCLRGFRPFSQTGFGALIIGTVRPWWIVAWGVGFVVAMAGLAVGVDKLLAAAAAAALCATLGVSAIAARHLNRRCGGLNGDCIGALIEVNSAVAATAMACVFALGAGF